jgi:hypothetical protein
MSVATMVGMLTAYPINSWMVRRGVKHGMMSAIPPAAMRTMPAMPMPAGGDKGAMPAAGAATRTSHRGGASAAAVSQGQKVALLVLTTLLFAAAVLVTSFFVPLPFT